MKLDYTNWAPGQPDNWANEDCGHLYSDGNSVWNDLPCDSRNGYICKMPLANSGKLLAILNIKNEAAISLQFNFTFLVSGRGLACEQQKTSNLIGFLFNHAHPL